MPGQHHGLINYKDTKSKCRLYWCLIEFIDWDTVSRVGIFDTALWTICCMKKKYRNNLYNFDSYLDKFPVSVPLNVCRCCSLPRARCSPCWRPRPSFPLSWILFPSLKWKTSWRRKPGRKIVREAADRGKWVAGVEGSSSYSLDRIWRSETY